MRNLDNGEKNEVKYIKNKRVEIGEENKKEEKKTKDKVEKKKKKKKKKNEEVV